MNTDLLFENARLQGRVIILEAEVKSLEAVIRAHERVDCLSVTSLKKQLVEAEAENARLKAEVERWKEASDNYRLMLQDRQAHLDAERKQVEQLQAQVERLTKAGDVLADFISPNPTAEMWGEEQAIKQAWENAKEGKQS